MQLVGNKFPVQDRHRPFDQLSWFKNFVTVLCRPKAPTYIELKKDYEPGDQRFEERGGIGPALSDSTGSQVGDLDMQDEELPSNAAANESRVETVERRIIAS